MSNKKYPQLNNPPIEEVIVRIQVSPGASEDALEAIRLALKEEYPVQKHWMQCAANEAEAEFQLSHSKIGYLICDEDEKKFVRFSHKEISLNQIKPYACLEDVMKEHERIIQVFQNHHSFTSVSEVSLRFVNKFEVATERWHEYFRMQPLCYLDNENRDEPISLNGTQATYHLTSLSHSAQAIVNVAILPDEDVLCVTMDIEVDTQSHIKRYVCYDDMLPALNKLRDFKNTIFFSNVPKAEELFS